MAYQIYRIGEWERVGGVDGYSTIRAYLQPGLYETQAFARKKSARLADQDYDNGGDGSFEVVAVGESPFDQRRPVAQRLVGGPSAVPRPRQLPILSGRAHDLENGCPSAPSHRRSSERTRTAWTSILGRGDRSRNRQRSPHHAEGSPLDPRPAARARLRPSTKAREDPHAQPC
jgi:hypothetical protein